MIGDEVRAKGRKAKEASRHLAYISSEVKNRALISMASALEEKADFILEANRQDVEGAEARGINKSLVDRLMLNRQRIGEMAEGLRAVAALPDPVGEVLSMWTRPNGLQIGKIRVPLGVVGMIYEARPNVTVDAAGLTLKTGNACLLRGGSEAIHSNRAITQVIRQAAIESGIPDGAIELIETTDREAVNVMLKMNEYLDVLIPRGGAGLIQTVVKNATVPVIETGVGNCHIYVDDSGDLVMAKNIVINAKCQRPGVCNAMETLLVHRAVAGKFLPELGKELMEYGVEIRGCAETLQFIADAVTASETDWETEFLDLVLAVRIVGSMEEAMEHIHRYGTKHSEAIITNDYRKSRIFTQQVDAAAVYVNASTRFTDGFQFGFGAEIGISTQKLHARGPMGLTELTTIKYIIFGDGQIRQ